MIFYFIMKLNKPLFEYATVRVACYALAGLLIATGAGFPLPDDGARHIAFARDGAIMVSWGQVFPHSLFFNDYDPWGAWHKLLRFIGTSTGFHRVHIAVNSIVLFLLMLLLDRLLAAGSKAGLSSLRPIFIILVAGGSAKILNLRPDSLSCLYAALAIGLGNGFCASALAALLYAPFYYLFFFYTGAIWLCQAITGKYRAAWGTFAGAALGLAWHWMDGGLRYFQTVANLFKYPEAGDIVITEQQPLFSFLEAFNPALTGVVLGFTSLILTYRFRKYVTRRPIAALLLITMPLWAGMARYFSLLMPLLKILILQVILDNDWKKPASLVKKAALECKELFGRFKDRAAFGVPAVLVAILVTSANLGQWDRTKELREAAFFSSPDYKGATILFNALPNSMYYALYHNSNIRTVPSCSIGWFEKGDPALNDIYERLVGRKTVSENEISRLARAVGASFYFHMGITPAQPLDFDKMKKAGLIPTGIVGKAVVFKVSP